MRRRPFFCFFGLHLNLAAKFRIEIELLNFTKLRENISTPRNLLNQQNIDAYALRYPLISDIFIFNYHN